MQTVSPQLFLLLLLFHPPFQGENTFAFGANLWGSWVGSGRSFILSVSFVGVGGVGGLDSCDTAQQV